MGWSSATTSSGGSWSALGHRVVVISGSYSHLFTRQPEVTGTYRLEDIDGLTYCWVRVPAYRRAISVGRVLNMVVFAARLYRLPIRRLPSPDAIVVSSPSLFPILPAERWARRWGAKFVFEVRDVWPLTLQELGRTLDAAPARRGDELVRAPGIPCRGRGGVRAPGRRSHLEAHGMAPVKLIVVPNGVTPDALDASTRHAPAHVEAAASHMDSPSGSSGHLAWRTRSKR